MRARASFALALALTACVTITPIAYNPQPERIADPAGEAKALIAANVVNGCIAETEVTSMMLTVKFVCSNGLGNYVARLDKVESIVLQESGGWYRVLVNHRDGVKPFEWTSKSLEDMRRLADALTALSAPPAPPKPATTSI